MKNNTLPPPSKEPDKSGKIPYSSPVFQVYGSVGQLTKGSSGSKTDGNSTNPRASDRNLKEKIIKVGDHPLGIGLYLFDYTPKYRETCGHGRQFGVMAQEVETVMPEAVSTGANGFKQVDYAMLGILPGMH